MKKGQDDLKEIKISQNYFINQINITNLKNRLIKQTKSKNRDSEKGSEEVHSSFEEKINSNFQKKFENEEQNFEQISEINVKLESESEGEEDTTDLKNVEKLEKTNTEKNFYYTSSNLNNNRLKNIFRSGKEFKI